MLGVLLAAAFVVPPAVADNPIARLASQVGLGPVQFCMSREQLRAVSPALRAGLPAGVPLTPSPRPGQFILQGHAQLSVDCPTSAALIGDEDGLSVIYLRMAKGKVAQCAIALEHAWTKAEGPPVIQHNHGPGVIESSYYSWQMKSFGIIIWDDHDPALTQLDVTLADQWRSPLALHHGDAVAPNACRPAATKPLRGSGQD